ncbi:winged helix-turn-helix transcriptional regulator [Schleiferilactobacillus perolens]|uniref:HTH hxlR-type domain-containing protein n=1 Tax=Schleiferilactobacillus perolens DSM 12744 TaxID=1423792 RepID=A0A0R1MXY7_9LACO|nr:helix-turn-helix domain-containing protein [Schleiferilactobacillus perolens]KRL12897.1 hypothetical protein FD09_GL002436 [Schleiferilactobacillus perolens DSM 12744]
MDKITTVAAKPYTEEGLCPRFAKIFSILGKKWNGLIIEALLKNGTQRFKELAAMVPACSDRVLVERLRELESENFVERVTHDDSALIEYRLTARGASLQPVMTDIHHWADEWITPEECNE